jgi:regulator of sigma E protease
VERNGEKLDLKVPTGYIGKLIKEQKTFLAPRFPFEIGAFVPGSAGEKAGLKKGDKLVGINNVQTQFFDEFANEIGKHKNEKINVFFERAGKRDSISVTVPEEGKLGIAPKELDNYFELEKKEYSFAASIPGGFHKAYDTFDNYIKQMKLIFSPEVQGYKHLGGFITLGSAFAPEWDWQRFWSFTAFLSIVLAIMNVLPIPGLDGGHVMFLLYEMITRRKPNEKAMEYAQVAGMVLLLGLMLFANGNDIMKLFK